MTPGPCEEYNPGAGPPSLEDVRAEILRIARKELGLKGEVAPDADLSEQLDSVQRLSLVVEIEDRFEVCFEADDDAQVRTLDDAAAIVLARLGEAGRG